MRLQYIMAYRFKDLKNISKLKALLLTGLIAVVVVVTCSMIISRGGSSLNSVNYKDGKFVNAIPNKKYTVGEYVEMTWKFFFGSKDGRVPEKPLPVVQANAFQEPASIEIQYNWLGHSSIILELQGRRLFFDPVFSEKASFSQFFGPKRFHQNPIPLEQLPHIDMVLISHNHYDHLDKMVVDHFKNSEVQFIVPLGIKGLLIRWGVKREKITELDWWEQHELDGLSVVSTPARHFSARGLFDRDKAFWTSWAILGENHRAFFSGDTGMTPQFSEIGEKYGPFDITFIKIGAYDERWPDMHLNPEEAVQAHIMLKGNNLVPIHWGTFDLGLHIWQEPIERIIVAANKNDISLLTSRIGETVIPSEHENSYWWRGLE
jgi:L-ascorbate metabolism protein UlaG (beta-lactamase superfamily)